VLPSALITYCLIEPFLPPIFVRTAWNAHHLWHVEAKKLKVHATMTFPGVTYCVFIFVFKWYFKEFLECILL
jgi:hypothetical protein